MNGKIKILVVGSVAAFLILAAIQYYLINNTYNYKISSFKREINTTISELGPEADSLHQSVINRIYKFTLKIYNKEIKKEAAVDSIFSINQNTELNRKIMDNFQSNPALKEIEYGALLDAFIIFDTLSGYPDTLFYADAKVENKIYGNLTTLEESIFVGKGTTNGNFGRSVDAYSLVISKYANINKWKSKVLWSMWRLIVLSLCVLLFVIGLFIYTLKSWMEQKKITDIKNDFINNISHEFRTPLASLSIAVKMLQKTNSNNDLITSNAIDSIGRQNNRLQNLLDQVMDKSLGTAQMNIDKKPTEENQFLRSIIDDFAFTLEGENYELTLESYESETLLIDHFHMTTVFFNLLDNAVKYGGGNRKITIKSYSKNKDWVAEVIDYGNGIPKDKLKTVFEKFYRINTGDVHDVKGLGLGLYYAKSVVEAHGGIMEIINGNKKGTTVRLILKNAIV